jgi:hypothetical protein
VIEAALIGGTIGLSALFGFAAGADLRRAISVGLYIVGAALLVGCFVVGVRGPLRGVSASGETVPLFGARGVRRATGSERSEASRTAILLFLIALSLILIGSAFDPVHSNF